MSKAEAVALHQTEAELYRRAVMARPAEFAKKIKIPGVPLAEMDDEDETLPLCTDYVTPAAHHLLILRALHDALTGQGPSRVALFLPPGAAKSTYALIFVAWAMGVNKIEVIHRTYGETLSRRIARKTRAVCASAEYRDLTQTTLAGDNKSLLEWGLANGSSYIGGGILGGATGNRADLLVIDDPVKGRDEADSETIRERVVEAYEDDLLTRLKPGAVEVLIMTRWHPADLGGYVLGEDWVGQSGVWQGTGGREWNVLCVPAKCTSRDDPLGREIGGWLWPEWFSGDYWPALERSKPARTWASLYQQRPTIAGGNLLKKEWIKYYDEPPLYNICVWAWDTATKDGEENDYSAGTMWAIMPEGYYLLHVVRDKMLYPELERCVYNTAERSGADAVLIEDKGSGSALLQRLQATTRLPVVALKARSVKGRKVIDFTRATKQFEFGNVFFPRSAPWLRTVEGEILNFPNASNDDVADSIAHFLLWAEEHAKDMVKDFDYYEQTGERGEARGGVEVM